MTPQLQTFAERDNGYIQFCNQYNRAATDPDTMMEFRNWVLDELREEGMRLAALTEGEEIGEARARGILQPIIDSKDAEITRLRALLAEKQ